MIIPSPGPVGAPSGEMLPLGAANTPGNARPGAFGDVFAGFPAGRAVFARQGAEAGTEPAAPAPPEPARARSADLESEAPEDERADHGTDRDAVAGCALMAAPEYPPRLSVSGDQRSAIFGRHGAAEHAVSGRIATHNAAARGGAGGTLTDPFAQPAPNGGAERIAKGVTRLGADGAAATPLPGDGGRPGPSLPSRDIAAPGRPEPRPDGPLPGTPAPPILLAETRLNRRPGNGVATSERAPLPVDAAPGAPASRSVRAGLAVAPGAGVAAAGAPAGPDKAPARAASPSGAAPAGEAVRDGVPTAPNPPGPAPSADAPNRPPLPVAAPPVSSRSTVAIAGDPADTDALPATDVMRAERPGSAFAPASPAHGAPGHGAWGHGTRAVTSRIAAAVQSSGERSVEIVLSPAELGKVRITLSPGEAGMTVGVHADRPETLDLLRRHADLLAQDFRDLGYQSTAFSFGGGGGASGQEAAPVPGDAAEQPEPAAAAIEADAAPRAQKTDHTHPDGRMDIRL